MENIPAEIPEFGMVVQVQNLDKESKAATLGISNLGKNIAESPKQKQEILSVTASVKPFVSLVWIGVLVMVLGFVVAMLRRLKESLIVSA